MINLFVTLGFQLLNVKALLDFKLIQRGCIINDFERRHHNYFIVLSIFRKSEMFENSENSFPEKDAHVLVCKNALRNKLQSPRK